MNDTSRLEWRRPALLGYYYELKYPMQIAESRKADVADVCGTREPSSIIFLSCGNGSLRKWCNGKLGITNLVLCYSSSTYKYSSQPKKICRHLISSTTLTKVVHRLQFATHLLRIVSNVPLNNHSVKPCRFKYPTGSVCFTVNGIFGISIPTTGRSCPSMVRELENDENNTLLASRDARWLASWHGQLPLHDQHSCGLPAQTVFCCKEMPTTRGTCACTNTALCSAKRDKRCPQLQ